MKIIKKIAVGSFALILLLGAGFYIYVSDYYKADETALDVLQTADVIQMDNLYILEGTNDTGIVFYPGGKVEAIAYLPILEQLNSLGYTVVLIEMPFNLAFFDQDAAEAVFEEVPLDTWYIAGHSLGGAMASAYASDNPEKVEGLILLGAYLYGSYPVEDQITIYGTFNDNLEPDINYTENIVVIEGGNHAQFGNYGPQKGDPDATISALSQQKIAVTAIDEFIKNRM